MRRAARQIVSMELLVLLALTFASLFWSQLLLLVVLMAILFWLLRLGAYGRLSVRTPADWCITVFILTLPLVLWASVLRAVTSIQVLRLLVGIVLFYAVVNWCTSLARLRLLINGLILAGLVLALAAPLSVEWAVEKLTFFPAGLYRRFTLIFSDTIHPNVLAGSLILLYPFALAYPLFCWRGISRRERILSLASAFLITVFIGLSRARGAWMAVGGIYILLAILHWRWVWVLVPPAALGAIGIATIIRLPRVVEILAYSNTLGGIDGRLEIWSRALYMIQDFPISGIGMGSFDYLVDTFYPFSQITDGHFPHAHNLFLQVAVDLGLVGLVTWLALFMIVVASSWQVYRNGNAAGNASVKGIGAALLCSQLALFMHGLTDAVTWGMVRPAPLVWIIWGLAIASLITTYRLKT